MVVSYPLIKNWKTKAVNTQEQQAARSECTDEEDVFNVSLVFLTIIYVLSYLILTEARLQQPDHLSSKWNIGCQVTNLVLPPWHLSWWEDSSWLLFTGSISSLKQAKFIYTTFLRVYIILEY